MDEAQLRALADRLRKGRLIAPATTILIEGLGEMSTGETREVSHPDAVAAADAIEWLLTHRRQAEEAMRERAAMIVEQGFRCRTCKAVFIDEPSGGHPDNGCSYPNWDKLEEESQATAIRSMEVE